MSPMNLPQDVVSRSQQAIREHGPRVARGASGVAVLTLLGASAFLPLVASVDQQPLLAFAASMGGNALAGWVTNWAQDGAKRALFVAQPSDEERLRLLADDLHQVLVAQTGAEDGLAEVLDELDVVAVVLRALDGKAQAQHDLLRTLQRDAKQANQLGRRLQRMTLDAIAQLESQIGRIDETTQRTDATTQRIEQLLHEMHETLMETRKASSLRLLHMLGLPDDATIAQLGAALRTAGVLDEPGVLIQGDVAGGDKVLGDKVLGNKIVYLAVADPLPPVDPAQAQATLGTMPTETIPAVATLPPGSRMPLASNPLFVGRELNLRALAGALKAGRTSVVTAGMGGVGKTSLAAEFAHRYGQFFAGGVFWLNVATAEGVPAEIAACGGAGAMRLPGFAALELADQVRRVLAEWAGDAPRLLVFDNCEDPALVRQYRPSSGACRILITSRDRTWETSLVDTVLPLGVLPPEESIALLRRFRPDLSDEEAGKLAEAMGHLPLGLHLTGSFLKRYPRVKVADYLSELSTVALDHLAMQGRGVKDKPIEREMNLARAFALSYDRLDAEDTTDALAMALLARAAYFAPGQALPRELLLASLPLDADDVTASYDRDDALERLLALGLLESEGEEVLRLHRLLHAFVLATATDTDAQAAVEDAMIETSSRLNDAGYPAPLLALQSHLRYVTDAAMGREDERAAKLCNEFGYHLVAIADYAAARPLYERALRISERTLGAEHPQTATSLNNLAYLHQSQGAYDTARPLYERALAIRERTLGAEHPDTATSLNNLAGLFYAQGAYEEARPLYERALAIRERTLGAEHPQTAGSLNNLAGLFRAQGAYDTARPLYERALAIRERTLGAEHPDTATSLNNLAGLFRAQGAYDTARPLYERALAIRERTLGAEHPQTATSLNNLAVLCAYEERFAEAAELMRRALKIRQRVLGADHPDTLSSRQSLAAIEQRLQGGVLQSREAAVAQALAQGDAEQRAALVAELEQRAQWAEDGEAAGSPWLALAARLRELAGQLAPAAPTPEKPETALQRLGKWLRGK